MSPLNLPTMPEYNGLSGLKEMYELAKNTFDQVRANDNVNNYVIGYPILWFGDFETYRQSKLKIVTVGINPSRDEFPDNSFCRFPAWNNLTGENYFKGLNEYFNADAYNWFTKLSNSISLEDVWHCSYTPNKQQNTALHIDYCTPLATNPTWSNVDSEKNKLPDDVKQYLQNIQQNYFQKLLAFLKPDIVFIGNAQCNDWETQDTIELLISHKYTKNSLKISSMIENMTTLDGDPHKNRSQLRCLKTSNGVFVIAGQYRNHPFGVYASKILRPVMEDVKKYYSDNIKDNFPNESLLFRCGGYYTKPSHFFYNFFKKGKENMTFTLAQLKERAASCGAELIELAPNGKLPAALRGKTGRELWLCVSAGTDEKLIYAAASRFDKIYKFTEMEGK